MKILLLIGFLFCATASAYPKLTCKVQFYPKRGKMIECGSTELTWSEYDMNGFYKHGVGVCKSVTLSLYDFGDATKGHIHTLIVARTTKKFENDEPSDITFWDNFPPRVDLRAHFSDGMREFDCVLRN